jgi:hypothetical protein
MKFYDQKFTCSDFPEKKVLPSGALAWVNITRLLCILEVAGSNFGLETGYTDWWFSWFFSVLPVEFCDFRSQTIYFRSRDSAVGIATGYDLDDRKAGVRVPVG